MGTMNDFCTKFLLRFGNPETHTRDYRDYRERFAFWYKYRGKHTHPIYVNGARLGELPQKEGASLDAARDEYVCFYRRFELWCEGHYGDWDE